MHAVPGCRIGTIPHAAHRTTQQTIDLVTHPRVRVHAVGDGIDGYLVDRDIGPQAAEHFAAHFTMQLGHAIRAAGQVQTHDGHVETTIAGFIGPGTQFGECVEGNTARSGEGAEVLLEQRPLEPIDTCGHRCMRGEHTTGPDCLDRLGKAQPVGHQFADALEREEPGVAFIGVEHLGLQAQRAQHADAADTEHDLLTQTVFGIAAVEAVGDIGTLCTVAVDCGVEQVEVDPAHLHPPGPHRHRVAGEVDQHAHTGIGERQPAGVEAGEALFLVSVGVESLAEVPLGVEQADGHQRCAQVARCLQVVAGQYAQAAAVLRQGFADTELG